VVASSDVTSPARCRSRRRDGFDELGVVALVLNGVGRSEAPGAAAEVNRA
jgi:hypothetical protein